MQSTSGGERLILGMSRDTFFILTYRNADNMVIGAVRLMMFRNEVIFV